MGVGGTLWQIYSMRWCDRGTDPPPPTNLWSLCFILVCSYSKITMHSHQNKACFQVRKRKSIQLMFLYGLLFWRGNYHKNKKVLLRERKRHTARRRAVPVGGTGSPILTWDGVLPVLGWGTSVLTWEGGGRPLGRKGVPLPSVSQMGVPPPDM